MVKQCHIKTCLNKNFCTTDDLNVMYYKFPLKYFRYHQWVEAIPTHLLDLPLRKHTYVCSAHFGPRAYKPTIYAKLGKCILRKYAYPTIFNNNDNKGNETTDIVEDIEKSPQQEIKETLSQTEDTSVKISAENIEELEEESLPTEYVQKCLHPRDQTTQTNMLQPYDLDDYDVIFEKDEIQSDEESDNNLHEIIITKNIVQPITELGNNLFEITMSSKNTKLVRNEIHPDKESESPVLFHHDASCQNMRQAMPEFSDSIQEEGSSMLMPYNICQATGQTIEVSSDSVQGKVKSPVLLYHGACKDMRQTRPELSNSIQEKGSVMLMPYGICQIKGQVMQVRPASIQDSSMLMLHGICQVIGQVMQVSDSTREKKSPLFLHNDQCQVTVQTIQESSDSTQGKVESSSKLMHHNTCQVPKQAMQESSDFIQAKESPVLLHHNQVTEQTMQESSDLTQEKESPLYGAHQVTQQVMQKSPICLKKKESPMVLSDNPCGITEETVQKSCDSLEEIVLLPKDCIHEVTGQAVQKSSDSLEKKKIITLKNYKLLTVASPLLLHNIADTRHVIQTTQKSSDTLEKKALYKVSQTPFCNVCESIERIEVNIKVPYRFAKFAINLEILIKED